MSSKTDLNKQIQTLQKELETCKRVRDSERSIARNKANDLILKFKQSLHEIEKLQNQLADANEVVGFYGERHNWFWGSSNFPHTYDSMSEEDDLEYICHKDCEHFTRYGRHHDDGCREIAGKRAREYQQKYNDPNNNTNQVT